MNGFPRNFTVSNMYFTFARLFIRGFPNVRSNMADIGRVLPRKSLPLLSPPESPYTTELVSRGQRKRQHDMINLYEQETT